MPTMYDLFVIGAGSGGVRAARIAASLGARVGICEAKRLGGTCVNVGCVPKKLFVYASSYPNHMRDAVGFGWSVEGSSLDWQALVSRKDAEILRLNGIYQRLLENPGVTILQGQGKILGPNRVQVGDETIHAKHILIATGCRPVLPAIPGIELAISSDEVFALKSFPQRVVIVGGGYIGVEFASIFSGMGAHVTLVHRGPRLLKAFDAEIVEHLQQELVRDGVTVMLNSPVVRLVDEGGSTGVELGGRAQGTMLSSDLVLMATGRRPNTENLGLETTKVERSSRGAIAVNREMQTAVPSIYAVGDVTDRVQLTPVALEEGMRLAHRLFGTEMAGTLDYDGVPTAVFTRPQMATVGWSEETALERLDEVAIYRSEFRALKHTVGGREERTLMKLVVDPSSDRVVGCHMVGDEAGEIIQGLAVALKAGATKAMFDQTVGIHPTAAEEFVTMRTRTR